ncbi:hypothetical protein B6V00_02980 [ANME-1 cluster archaeon ex4572_4]|nr:MAG: hypothetical protein B6V00_02980 [ANME-1 cluster archaeon ex4572_4]RLB88653.1 MAG: hypothetical protein DRH10_07270 [Deltaproteobacteria bacterium]
MRLEDVHRGERIFIDTNIFTYLLVKDKRYINSVKSFLKKVEGGFYTGFFNLTVFDETSFNFIKLKVIKKYGIKRGEFSDFYKQNPNLVREIDFEPVLKLFSIDNLNLLTPKLILELVTEFSSEHALLPADAIILATMKEHSIVNLASNDHDFERVDWITLYKP